MKIIYDATKAEQEKLRLDTEIPERNRKNKVTNRILAVVCILWFLAILVVTAIGCIYFGNKFGGWAVLLCIIAGVLIEGGICYIYLNNAEVIMPAERYYSPAIQYHIAMKDKKILNIETLGTPPWKLTLILEDENHVVTKEEINLHFPNKVRTDISETIIDLDQKIVYTPYTKQTSNDDAEGQRN